MDKLPVTKETAEVLMAEYGYKRMNVDFPWQRTCINFYTVFPRAKALIEHYSVDETLKYLSIDDVLSLELLPNECWDSYLSKL